MKVYSPIFKADSKFKMNAYPTSYSDKIETDKAHKKLDKVSKKLSELQDRMYAHDRYSVLVCIQGMDTAGKDSLIREVFKTFNARGVTVNSFKTPTSSELEHDYLWRHYLVLPERGKFSVFNRTHYENVLVTRVHPEYVLNEKLPGISKVEDIKEPFWEERYEQINNFEKHIRQNGVIQFKFYLHLSKQEQKNRLLRRLEKHKHNWKFSPSDLEERKKWDLYMRYYEETIRRTSPSDIPWYIIPADNKEICRYLVAKIMLEKLEELTDIKYPKLAPEIKADIDMYRDELKGED